MQHVPSNNESSGRAYAARQSEVGTAFSRAQDGSCWTLGRRALQADQRSEAEWRTISRRPSPPHRRRRSCRLGLESRRRPGIAASFKVGNRGANESLDRWRRSLSAVNHETRLSGTRRLLDVASLRVCGSNATFEAESWLSAGTQDGKKPQIESTCGFSRFNYGSGSRGVESIFACSATYREADVIPEVGPKRRGARRTGSNAAVVS
jgi:hypothetical protein